MNTDRFKKLIWSYYNRHGRHTLPWRFHGATPARGGQAYKILVSEVMLQQTQVDRVIPKYKHFIKTFPNFSSLAKTPLKEVLRGWQGLGYNRRALRLKRTAEIVVTEYGGRLPHDEQKLLQLPGIGPYTAGAIRAFAFNKPAVFIETNIRAVFLHHFFPAKKKVRDKEVVRHIVQTLPVGKSHREWYYALMDYGAHIKTQTANPNRRSTHYAKQPRFKGSNRELRGKILKILLVKSHSAPALVTALGVSQKKLARALKQLQQEKLLRKHSAVFSIA
ncbi:A/G-specific adenine glycosylase [Candidatus Wolfebacteria bacterium]|nr:A/G-specific adenine glycosylase [Candidatus Wolfebacteria bacterium]